MFTVFFLNQCMDYDKETSPTGYLNPSFDVDIGHLFSGNARFVQDDIIGIIHDDPEEVLGRLSRRDIDGRRWRAERLREDVDPHPDFALLDLGMKRVVQAPRLHVFRHQVDGVEDVQRQPLFRRTQIRVLRALRSFEVLQFVGILADSQHARPLTKRSRIF